MAVTARQPHFRQRNGPILPGSALWISSPLLLSQAATASASGSGRRMVKIVSTPSVLSTPMVPP